MRPRREDTGDDHVERGPDGGHAVGRHADGSGQPSQPKRQFGPEIFGEKVGYALIGAEIALPLYVAPGGGGEFPDEGLLQLAELPVVELPPVRQIDDIRRAQRIAPRRYLSNDGRSAPGEDRERLLQRQRSEEHTSELPSLMRISYAVLCLKKN